MGNLTEKDKEKLSKPYLGHVSLWRRTIFWENIKRTCAIGGGSTTYGIYELGGADHWMAVAAIISFVGAGISIWFTDNDNNGVVDILQ